MPILESLVLICCFTNCLAFNPGVFSNKTELISDDCVPFAFADFDSDKNIEIYCASATTISVLKYDSITRSANVIASKQLRDNQIVTGMLAVDLNSDSIVDTVVMYKNRSNPGSIAVIWGNKDNLDDWNDIPFRFANWPIATTVFPNSVELFGSLINNTIGFLSFNSDKHFSFIPMNISQTIDPLLTQAFIDLTGDSVADIFLTLSDGRFEIWSLENGNEFQIHSAYSLPSKQFKRIYPSVFFDVAASGEINQIVPVCIDDKCNKCDMQIRRGGKWESGLVNTSLPNGCRMLNPEKIKGFWGSSTPLSMKVADVNLDNYPDLLGICENDKGDRYLAFFMNVEHNGQRKFAVSEENLLPVNNAAIITAFFDLEENGFPDILVSSKNKNDGKYSLSAIENKCGQDAYFFKVMVIGGGCRRNGCSYNSLPRGENYPGASITLQITNKRGHVVNMKAGQSSSNALFALQLPYVTFGLGDLPSFVEHVTVSVGRRVSDDNIYSRQWSQMIPNSQILVVPYPLHSPRYWHTRLYVNPSRLIFYIGIALAILCFLVLSLVITLQVKEKQEDENEKKHSLQYRFDTL